MIIPAYIVMEERAEKMMRISSAPIHLTNRSLVKILTPVLRIVIHRNAVETTTSWGPLLSVDDILTKSSLGNGLNRTLVKL